MTEDVWSEQGTTPDAIEAALREMLRERLAANEALAPARVLNLVVIVDRSWKGEIANRLERVGRYHASRTVLCAVEDGRKALDAVAIMSYDGRLCWGLNADFDRLPDLDRFAAALESSLDALSRDASAVPRLSVVQSAEG